MAAAAYKFDEGQSFSTQCFPAGTLHHRRRDGAGHWLVAYRKAEEQKYRNVHRRVKDSHKNNENRVTDTPRSFTLDGLLLLQLRCVDHPSELCSVDISEHKLNSVKPEDLKMFINVAYIDASINSLSLGSFSSFVSLRELNLALNGICSVTFDAADFPFLEVLDLSYNNLSGDGIVSLGQLPRLKVLHLTGNQLRRLPPSLGSSHQSPTQLPTEEDDTRFKSLEVLMLDDNRLSSGVFHSLANLKRLRCLNLKENRISEIPCMQLMGCSKPVQISTEAEEEGLAHSESDPNTDEHLKIILQIFQQDDWEEYCKGNALPLPELQFLNLANNKITREEVLIAAALFPMLREVDIQSNPLTTRRRGDPPLLMYLQERLGITIKRKKTEKVVKLPVKVSTDPKWKFEEKTPKVSKKRVTMDGTCPAQSQGDRRKVATKRATGSEGNKSRRCTFQENAERFFITQAADVPEFDVPSEEKETTENKKRNNNSPKQFTGSKTQMDAKPNPDALKSIAGTETTVWMLEHALNNLHVYRDSKPKLDRIQRPYREKKKRIKELPPLKPMKQPTERVDEMIQEIRKSTTVKVVALDSVINSAGTNKEEYKEALSLLRDLKTKYKRIHKRMMEQTAGVESDKNTNQKGAEPLPNAQ